MNAVDFAAYRALFPIFKERIYFATQCMGPFPEAGYRDLEEYVRTRSRHSRSLGDWLDRIEEVTGLIEHLLGVPSGSVALRESATACQAAFASAMSPEGARKRIVVTSLDFHSSLHLWCAQERRGFEIVVVPTRDQMSVDSADVVAAIDERTSLVAVSLVSRNSALLNVGPVIRRAREVGALVALDAYQAVGIYPLDPVALDVDVLVAGCLKWLSGETGLAFMYVKPELAERLEPGYPGWFGHQELHAFVHTHAFVDKFRSMPGARRFQQGTPPVEPIYGSRAGLRFVLEVGVEAMRRRNNELTDYLLAGSLKRGFDVRTPHPTSERAGGICLGAPDPEKVVEALAREGIDVDQRRQLLVRLAPHPCCTIEDCERVLDAFGRVTASS